MAAVETMKRTPTLPYREDAKVFLRTLSEAMFKAKDGELDKWAQPVLAYMTFQSLVDSGNDAQTRAEYKAMLKATEALLASLKADFPA